MVLVPVIMVVIFNILPMAGTIIAFKDYKPGLGIMGSPWVGWANFQKIFMMPDTMRAIRNTLIIAIWKIVLNQIVPIIFALLLNELRCKAFKRTVQTITYLPYFISWVVLAGIFIDILSPRGGLVNNILGAFGVDPIFFLGSNETFRGTMIVTDVWKNFGYNTIIYLSALTGIDPALYEAAAIDGAGRWKQTLHITLPGIAPFIVLMVILATGNVLNAGFDQIFNMYSVSVYETGDILDTLVYRTGMQQYQYSLATAIGLFKSVVSLILISGSNFLATKFSDYRVF